MPLLLLLAGAIARADDETVTARTVMAAAMQDLATNTSLSVVLVGTETVDEQVTTFGSVTSLKVDLIGEQPVLLLESQSTIGGVLTQRIVGDGAHLWDFKVAPNTYSCATYGSVDYAQPANYRQKLMQLFSLRAVGANKFVAKLLTEAYGSGPTGLSALATRWTPWLSTAAVTMADRNVVCDVLTPEPARLTYVIAEPDENSTSLYRLAGAAFERRIVQGSKVKIVRWQVAIVPGKLAAGTDFGFIPPRNARNIANGYFGE